MQMLFQIIAKDGSHNLKNQKISSDTRIFLL
nr:MAG TPA: hypothetical protein [Caudoviricetes sp.]DAT09915.1 MAG TPA: hypothetical protein [Caudoviricetes sp.]